MSILVNKNTKVITQGITGKTASSTRMCREYANGRNCFVAGVNPKRRARFRRYPDLRDSEGSQRGHGPRFR